MPLELQVIRASEFVRVGPNEELDFAATKQALEALALACLKRGVDRAMLDLRAVPVPAKPKFTPTELAALVSTFRQAGFSRQQRLAILYQQDVYGGVQIFAFISRMRGLAVRAFNEFEMGLQWLGQEQETADEDHRGEVPVPIHKGQAEVRAVPVSEPEARPVRLRSARRARKRSEGGQ
jgi:hypothetical protein